MESDVSDLQSLNTPEGLIGIIEGDILQFQIPHLPEEFRCVDDGIPHGHIITIPDGGTRTHFEITIGDERVVNMPQRILPDEVTVINFQVGAALDARLPLRDGHILQPRIMNGEQRTFTTKLLIFYQSLHFFQSYPCYVSGTKIQKKSEKNENKDTAFRSFFA